MKRKEQEARIEQQRQEKEKAREDAARERARYENMGPYERLSPNLSGSIHSPLPAPRSKGPGGAPGRSQRGPAGSHGGAAEEDPDEGKLPPAERSACPSAIVRESAPVSSPPQPLQHDESSRRHMEQIEQRKEKAAELSSGRHANTDYAPKLTPYERKKQCSLCCVEVGRP